MSQHLTAAPSAAARTWRDYRLDITGGPPSDAPRLPADQAARLVAEGADPLALSLLISEPPRSRWPLRAAAWGFSFSLGAAAAVSDTVAGAVGATVAGTADVVAAGGHVVALVGVGGSLGLAGRLLSGAALVAALGRVGWRLTRWGAGGVGE